MSLGIARLPHITVIEDQQNGIVGFEIGVVLMGEPGVRIGGLNLEITLHSHAPENVTLPGAVGVVDLDHPVLMAGGVQNVSVRRQLQRIAVEPVVGEAGKVERRTAYSSRVRTGLP